MSPPSLAKSSRAPHAFLRERSNLAAIILIVFVTLVVYTQTLGHGFIIGYDDGDYVTKNQHVQAGLTLASIEWAFSSFDSSNWHPLTWISHMLDCRLFGLNAGGHHATNVILHVASALLLYAVLRRMTKSVWRSAFVAILFAVHPLHVESVAWISERKDLLSGFLAMLTIWAYVRYVERPGFRRYALVVLALAAGLMSKPMLVTMPFVLLLLDYWPLGRFAQKGPRLSVVSRPVLDKLPLLILSAISCVVTVIAQERGGAVRALDEASVGFRVSSATIAYLSYIGKMLWPHHLAIPYLNASNVLPISKVVASAVILAAFTFLAIMARKSRPYLLVGWLWYLGTLVPVIGLVQVGPQALADRYTYLPLIGLFLIIAWGAPDILRSVGVWECGGLGDRARSRRDRLVLPTLAVAVTIALMVSAFFQAGRWRDTFTLFEYVLSVNGGNRVAHNALGMAYEETGRLDEAVTHYSDAVSLDARFFEAYFNLGNVLARQGKLDEAVAAYSQVLATNPNHGYAYNNLGAALLRLGRTDAAVDAFRKATELTPDDPLARRNLEVALGDQAKGEAAIADFRRILKSDPRNAWAHCQLGNILAGRQEYDGAVRHFRETVRIAPEYAEARRNLAMVLFFAGRYSEAWREVRLCGRYKVGLNPAFIRRLSDKMPDPQGR